MLKIQKIGIEKSNFVGAIIYYSHHGGIFRTPCFRDEFLKLRALIDVFRMRADFLVPLISNFISKKKDNFF